MFNFLLLWKYLKHKEKKYYNGGNFTLKRIVTYIMAVLISISMLSSCAQSTDTAKDISEKIIRFHVIANSDSASDQNVKLKVRDRVLKEIAPKMQKLKTKTDSEKFIKSNLGYIKKIASSELSKNGKSYGVDVTLGKSQFPVKVYSNIALPPGEYDALKIVLGKGVGKNWWCVMFPPLCFVDITHNITSKETENGLKKVLNDDEYNSILTKPEESESYEVTKSENNGTVQKDAVNDKKPVEPPAKQEADDSVSKQDTGDSTIDKDADDSTTKHDVDDSKIPADNSKTEIKFKSVEIIKSFISTIKGLFK